MKVVSLFAGIGGFDLALIRQGHKIVYANEWNKYAAQIYRSRFDREENGEVKTNKERKYEKGKGLESKERERIGAKNRRDGKRNNIRTTKVVKKVVIN